MAVDMNKIKTVLKKIGLKYNISEVELARLAYLDIYESNKNSNME